jgi:hypothetical protein
MRPALWTLAEGVIMTDEELKRKLYAAGKVTFGIGRGISAVLLATGQGLMGAYFKKHHMMGAAGKLGSDGLKEAQKIINEGLEQWKKG